MKKNIILLTLLFISILAVNAQDSKVVSAFNYYKYRQPAEAKKTIDEAILDPKSAKEAKTWLYRGNIYLLVYRMAHYTDGLVKGMTLADIELKYGKAENIKNYKKLPNGSKISYDFELVIYLSDNKVDSWDYPGVDIYKSLDDGNALKTSYESYQKSIELDPNYYNEFCDIQVAMLGLGMVGDSYYNKGIDSYNNKKYKDAFSDFEMAIKIYQITGKSDENLVYYAGLSAEISSDTAKAIENYSSLVKSKAKKLEAYANLANIYLNQNKVNKALEVIKKGREMDPKNLTLLKSEANIYLKEGKTTEAKNVITLALEQDPNNYMMHFAIGTLYDKIINDTTKSQEDKDQALSIAIEAYNKAIAAKPDYEDAYFNAGTLYNNRAAEVYSIAKNLPLGDANYDVLIEKGNKLLTLGIPYLEKAHEINPKEKNTLILLKNAYVQTKNTEKYKEVKAKLDAMK